VRLVIFTMGFSYITSGLSVLLGHSWDRAHARSETEVMTSFSRSGHPLDCRTGETASLGPSPYVLKVLSRYVAGDKTDW
jgi:hypothetical protein